jgi:hypothetical protein
VSVFTPHELGVGLVFFLQTTPQGLSLGLVLVFPLYLHRSICLAAGTLKFFSCVEWNEQRIPVFLHTRGRLCFCCWLLLYFTTDCNRSTVKFWFLPLDIFPLSFSRHRRLVHFLICTGPVCTCPFFNLHWSGLPLSAFQSALVRFALVRSCRSPGLVRFSQG